VSSKHRLAPSPELRRHWQLVRALLIALIATIGVGSWWLIAAATPSKPPAKSAGGLASHVPPVTSAPPVQTSSSGGFVALTASGPGWLAPGSDPSVLPGPLLIADAGGNRVLIIDSSGRTMWQFPRPGDLSAGQTFKAPDDAWFTPNGRQIIATGEDDNVIYEIDVATHKITYTYGTSGVPGSGDVNQLNGPDGVLMLPSDDLLAPDAGNCRVIMIPPGSHMISRQLGQTGTCVHNPPQSFSSPSGLFPMSNGDFLVTEGNGHWVSEMSLSGKLAWSVQVPGVSFIYETSEVGPDRYATVDHTLPGQALTFDHTGRVLWRYAPTGSQALNKPSLVSALPNGDFIVSDKGNNRIIVVDPRTNAVVWQYGHSQVAGSTPGFLNQPTGMDLYPPNSMMVKAAATMGTVPR